MPWFGARTLFLHKAFPGQTYEERINVIQAYSEDDALLKAEEIAKQYADESTEFLNYTIVFEMFDDLGDKAEVFSLMRESDLAPEDYIDRYFDTGSERTR